MLDIRCYPEGRSARQLIDARAFTSERFLGERLRF
jgi:hypothetical protein